MKDEDIKRNRPLPEKEYIPPDVMPWVVEGVAKNVHKFVNDYAAQGYQLGANIPEEELLKFKWYLYDFLYSVMHKEGFTDGQVSTATDLMYKGIMAFMPRSTPPQ